MRVTLVHPPFDDPTLPYHATAYLAGHLAANGFTDVATRDVNVEFVNWCLEESVLLWISFSPKRALGRLGEMSIARNNDMLQNKWKNRELKSYSR